MREPVESDGGFTLMELLTVLVILAAMVTVAVPHVRQSNESQRLDGECRSMAETIAYALDLAEGTQRSVRFVLDGAARHYRLEVETDPGTDRYEVLEDGRRLVTFMHPRVSVLDLEGFAPSDDRRHILTFSSSEPWPAATVSLATGNRVGTITIKGRIIQVVDTSE